MSGEKELANLLKALADPTRLRVLDLLHRRGESCVCELEAMLGMTQSNISFHLNALKAVDLVTDHKVGRWVFYRLNERTVRDSRRNEPARTAPRNRCTPCACRVNFRSAGRKCWRRPGIPLWNLSEPLSGREQNLSRGGDSTFVLDYEREGPFPGREQNLSAREVFLAPIISM
jgi:DNA-binding transcriptional ArsR family regulator